RETRVLKAGAKDTAAVNALPSSDAARTVTYYDGLGFPSQVISVAAVPGGQQDLVLHREYDRYMRESRVFLPYVSQGAPDAGYRRDAATETSSFYLSPVQSGMPADSAPCSVTVFDNSTLDRVLQQGAPGTVWQPAAERTDTSGRTVVTGYGTCDATGPGSVRIWSVTDSGISSSGCYLPGRLVKQTVKGENWTSGLDGTVDIFTDLSGNTVLERNWVLDGRREMPLDTYHVYDLLGRLRYVLPPMLCASLPSSGDVFLTDDDTAMQEYAYLYRYNGHGDCIWKRLPGCAPVSMQYDRHHRLVMSQDGNQALEDSWTVQYYDGLGRPAVSYCGPSPAGGDISTMEFTARLVPDGMTGGYSLSPSLPAGASLQKILYYDSYGFIGDAPEALRDSLKCHVLQELSVKPDSASVSGSESALVPVPMRPVATSQYDRYGSGRQTGAITWTVGDTRTPLYSSFYYDDRGRMFQSRSQNHLGGWESESVEYSFTGQPLQRTLLHSTGTSDPVVEVYSYTYDNQDRLLTVTHRLDGFDPVTLADNSYDALGRLSSDSRNGVDALGSTYSYNIRSWMTGIGGEIFSERMYYNEMLSGTASWTPQFNGNLSAMDWTGPDGGRSGYSFSYDGLGRLTRAAWTDDSASREGYGTSYSYDLQGNIMSISRDRPSASGDMASAPGEELMMAYRGNRLHAMSDHGESMVPDHIAGSMPSGMTQYAYDRNGNMTRDLNSGITLMSYNHLNLPLDMISATESGVIDSRYLYSADGVKLSTLTIGPSGDMKTDYSSSIVYKDGVIERILVDGGYIIGGEYRFLLTDHLGSIRAVADARGNVLERYGYYPYGKETGDASSDMDSHDMRPDGSPEITGNGMLSGDFGSTASSQQDIDSQPYRFNGKESQEFTGLPLLDYGARFYNPTATRWTTMDPMAEKYYSVSPYAFCSGNPVNFVDPDGEDFYVFDSNGNYKEKMEIEGQHRIAVHSTVTLESGETYDHYDFFDFADPENDPASIDNGEITKIIQTSENEIYDQLVLQGMSNASMKDFYRESGGGGLFDYYTQVVSTHYKNPDSNLYLPKGEKVAHNAKNYGNFLWAATGYTIGFPALALRAGAHYNSYFDPMKGNGYKRQWDSKDDQLSIILGASYAKTHKFRKR
ncbi:MAG: RHS repeat-associated core domain-containing protein, partial [Bacteroidales bacterium]|nr:RHS repeat-associated core domain-containing protein [Bacteroidales bacterium]